MEHLLLCPTEQDGGLHLACCTVCQDWTFLEEWFPKHKLCFLVEKHKPETRRLKFIHYRILIRFILSFPTSGPLPLHTHGFPRASTLYPSSGSGSQVPRFIEKETRSVIDYIIVVKQSTLFLPGW